MRTKNATVALVSGLALAVGVACGSTGGTGGGSSGGDGGSGDATSDTGGGDVGSFTDGNKGDGSGDGNGGAVTDANFPCDGCAPFPGQGTATCSPQTLGAPTLVYPLDGLLLPPNMNVLEVQWVPPATGTAALYEVDFTNGVTNVTVETACNPVTTVRGVANVGCGLTLSQQAWNDIANTNRDGDPVKVTVRATPAGGACVTASPQSVSLAFAKDDLTGGIYYWQSATYGGVAGTTGGIYYHDFGTFDPAPTPFYTSGGTGTCIGCHTLSKDGVNMSLMFDDPDADDEFGDVHTQTLNVPTRTALGGNGVSPGFQTFTHDHAYMVASTFKGGGGPGGPDGSFAVWTGDGKTLAKSNALPTGTQGTQPNLSQDDKTLVFVAPGLVNGQTSISQAGDHHFLGGSLWSAAFNETTSTLSGYAPFLTATGAQNFYYPDQSVDANWVVFNENDDNSAANNDGDCFYSRKARVKIMHFPPQSGDVPLDLTALNVADGLTNSWPRWSPALTSYHGAPILWVTFSSNRDYGLHLKNTVNGYPQGAPLDAGNTAMSFDNYYPPESPAYDQPQPVSKQGVTFDDYAAPQIWMAAVVVDPNRALDGKDRSYPAFWLPFQDVTAHNHSAQWVSQVQGGGPGPDGGTGGDGGAGGDGGSQGDGAPACGEATASCGSGELCCTDVVCCAGSCQATCAQ